MGLGVNSSFEGGVVGGGGLGAEGGAFLEGAMLETRLVGHWSRD